MLAFNFGTLIFQLISLLVPLSSVVFIILAIIVLTSFSRTFKSLEKQNTEIIKMLTEINEKIDHSSHL